MTEPSEHWLIRKRPGIMTRRFDFAGYRETRQFLDDLSDLSQRVGYYPDLNFGKTHVNVSVAAQGEDLGDSEYAFSAEVDTLAARQAG